MKLFTKSLLFFISVIVFQSSLTILLITNITTRSNLEDAGKALRQEAAIVFDNYNSWKRGIWKILNDILQDQQLLTTILQSQDIDLSQHFRGLLQDRLYASGVDIAVLKYSAHQETDIIPITYNNFSLSDVDTFENTKSHPYLEMKLINTQLCMLGVLRLFLGEESDGASRKSVDLFLLKRIDKGFCTQLVLNRHSHAIFFLDSQYLSGTLGKDRLQEESGGLQVENSSHERYDLEIENLGYNVAIRRIERIPLHNAESHVFLMTMLSNLSYINRVSILERTVLSVTALSALLTILLSLFFSRNMTRPIRNLLAAMQRLRSGQYDTTVTLQVRNEIGALFQGFNDMASTLRQDKEQMEDYIREITLLKDYNEDIIHSIRAGMIIVNGDLRVEKVNSSFLDVFELQEAQILGVFLQDLPLAIFDRDVSRNVRAILQKEYEEFTLMTRSKRNRVYELKLYPIDSHDAAGYQANGNALGCIIVVEDISRKIEFEEKIFQAEKLSSISMLSAGVAHEINNPLGSIMTNVQNLLDEEEDEERTISLKWIEQETRRIARIVKDLLEFSSSNLDRIQETDVNKVIADTIVLITYSLKKTPKILIYTELEGEMPLAMISPDEFKQIIINLVKMRSMPLSLRAILLSERKVFPRERRFV